MKRIILILLIISVLLGTAGAFALGAETTKVVSSKNEKDGIEVTVRYQGLYKKQIPETYEYQNPKTKEISTLPLVEANYLDGEITDRSCWVKAEIDYGWESYIPNPSSEITVDYLDKASGKTLSVKLHFDKLVQEQNFRWLDDITANAVFEVYDAEYYKLKDTEIYIPYNDVMPEIKGKEEDLVKAIKEDPKYLRFLTSKWDGEVYTEKGVEKRNAIFSGERYVAQYKATYLSEISLPNLPGYDCIATYRLDIPLVVEEEKPIVEVPKEELPTVEAENEIVVVEEKEELSLLEKILIASGGVVILCGLFILILFITRRRLAKDIYEEDDTVLQRHKHRRIA